MGRAPGGPPDERIVISVLQDRRGPPDAAVPPTVRGPRPEPRGRPLRRALAGGCGAPGRLAGGRGRGTAPAQSHAQLRASCYC